MTIREAAKLTGLSSSTLRRYTATGVLPDVRSPGGIRIFRRTDLPGFKPADDQLVHGSRVALYARVSTAGQRQDGDLDRQLQRLRDAATESEVVGEFTDVASGLSERRPGLARMLRAVINGQVDRVLVDHKDRLARIGVGYLEVLFEEYNCEIVTVSGDEAFSDSSESELVRDLIAVMTSFTARLHGERGNRAKRLAREARLLATHDETSESAPAGQDEDLVLEEAR